MHSKFKKQVISQKVSLIKFQNVETKHLISTTSDPLDESNSLSQANVKLQVSRKLKRNTGTQFSEIAIMPQIP